MGPLLDFFRLTLLASIGECVDGEAGIGIADLAIFFDKK